MRGPPFRSSDYLMGALHATLRSTGGDTPLVLARAPRSLFWPALPAQGGVSAKAEGSGGAEMRICFAKWWASGKSLSA